MRPPADIVQAIEEALAAGGSAKARIIEAAAVGGGCISPAARIETEDGRVHFAKWGDASTPVDFFREEARSLDVLARAGALRVPAVRRVDDRWLLLEWLEPGRPVGTTWADLGRGLAAMHRRSAAAYGWEASNFIGSLPQTNRWTPDWPSFWREERIRPQLERARGAFGRGDLRRFDDWLSRTDDVLADAADDGPSLLHGDLWNGNVHVMADGAAALIDPSSAYGHREVDLAMAELFGGFGGDFLAAYAEAWPLRPGYREQRRAAYQLYYLLVHVNLFGGSYVAGALSALRAAGG